MTQSESLTGTSSPGTAEAPGSRTFADGQMVAERYCVVRFLAAGGMGEVYEVDDQLLHERVALKTVRAAASADERTLARFRSEIQLARKVTHANVCRTFDLGFHGPVAFLTMELLAGETLDERLRRGPMGEAEARSLAAQVAAALDAAHAAGVIHRDLSGRNVVLAAGGRAVVTDFGLAAPEQAAASDSAGTIGSMAPEQLAGDRVTAAADVYAFGVLLYQMVTGEPPFPRDRRTRLARRDDPPPSPRQVAPSLSPRWERAILRCLAPRPGDRFGRASEAVAALRPPRRRWPALVAGVGLAVAVAVALAGTHPWRHQTRPARAVATTPGRIAVAVLPLRNGTGDPNVAWVSTAVTELVASHLAAGDHLRTVPGEEVARAVRELDLAGVDDYGAETLGRLRERLGADYVVGGSYLARADSDELVVLVHVQNTKDAEKLLAATLRGSSAEPARLAADAGGRIRAILGFDPPTAVEAAGAAMPADPGVARLYFQGLAAERAGDALQARALIEQALDGDRENPLLHLALADTLLDLGESLAAQRELIRAREHAASLSWEQQTYLEARVRAGDHDYRGSAEEYRKLFDAFPEDPGYGMTLWSLQAKTGDVEGAAATLARLRQRPELRDSDELAMMEEQEATMRGDHAEAARLADQIAARAEETGRRGLVAEAHSRAAMARWAAGDLEGAQRDVDTARAIYRETTGYDLAKNLLAAAAGLIAIERGDLAAARTLAETHREHGERGGEALMQATSLHLLAIVTLEEGDLAGAERNARGSMAIWSELCEASGTAGPRDGGTGPAACDGADHAMLAEIALAGGRAADAEREADAALAANADLRWPAVDVDGHRLRALALAAQGKVAEARAAAAHAVRLAGRVRQQDLLLAARTAEAVTLAASGRPDDVAEARRRLEGITADAAKVGFLREGSLARLEYARLTPGDEGETIRDALARDAAAHGFTRIARAARGGAIGGERR